MPQEQSIPKELEGDVLRRFTRGRRPGQIVKWLKEEHDVSSSRSSVNRLIDRLLEGRGDQEHVAIVNRIRSQASHAQDEFERVGREFRTSFAEMKPGMPDNDLKVRIGQTLALSRMSVHYQRALRSAGVIGRPAQQVLEAWNVRQKTIARDVKSDRFTGDNPLIQAGDQPVTASPEAVMSTDPLSLQRAAEAGASMSPCPIVATPVRPEDPLPLSDALPLTPSEAHYRDACAQSWRDQLTLKGHAQPDEGSLRDRVTQEIQFQKRATQLAHAFDDPPSTRVIVKSTWLELDAEVPPPHAASRDAREAWRLGDRWMPLVLELVGIAAAASVKDAPLSPRERAWCAGAGRRAFLEAEGNPDRRPLPEYVALMEQLARREKWRCREEGHRAGTRIVRIPVWEEPEAFHEAA